MTLFSKTVSFNDMVPILPALDLPVTLKMLFSHKNFVHALAGAVVSTSYTWLTCDSICVFVRTECRHTFSDCMIGPIRFKNA